MLFLPLNSESARVDAPDLPSQSGSAEVAADLLSNAEFVYGPDARRFDLTHYLEGRGSPLLPDVSSIEGWCAYASVNPQVVLALLELDGAQVTQGWKTAMPPEARHDALGDWITGLAQNFYHHLYEYGERSPAEPYARPEPAVQLADGSRPAVSPEVSSATFTVLDALAPSLNAEQFAAVADPAGPGGFLATWADLFPDSNPLDTSVAITPDALPPANLLQFPFPVGQTWFFNGAHNWSGSAYGKPYSSIDFFTTANSCSAPPSGDWAVAAASGSGYHPNGQSCWYRIDHADGWSTSYYHLRNGVPNGQIAANSRVGTIACETCAGGFATGPHVHFTLLYNGAYVDLEGVTLSGWIVHSGNGDYETGSLERSGVQLRPYSTVLNEGLKAGPSPTPTPPPTPTPSPSAAKFTFPKAANLIRSCPVTLVADATVPPGGYLRFLVRQGSSVAEAGRDSKGSDGWQAQWDCQGAADGAATLSLSVFDASGRELLHETGQTAVTLSKKCNDGTYRTAFFPNTTLAGLPASSWCKASGVNYYWGTGSPGAGIAGSDKFSARFRGKYEFAAGIYRFKAQADDGIRVWVDRTLVLDEWHGHSMNTGVFSFARYLSKGLHEVWLDYYEQTGAAGVNLSWSRLYGGAAGESHFLPLLLR